MSMNIKLVLGFVVVEFLPTSVNAQSFDQTPVNSGIGVPTLESSNELVGSQPTSYPGSYPGSFGGNVDFSSSFYRQSQQCGLSVYANATKSDSGSSGFVGSSDSTSFRVGASWSKQKCTDQEKLELLRQKTQIVNTCTESRTQLALASKDPDLACNRLDLVGLGFMGIDLVHIT